MSHSLSDYFALEAGEYLEQLDALLSGGGAPDAERFFRLARGVRGSARVAQEAEIAAVAEGLEGAARALQDGRLSWSEEVRALAVRTVDDLKVLVRARGRWSAAEEARAREAAARWEGVAAARERPADVGGAGDRYLVFLRREVTGVVSALDHAADTLRRAPSEREPLHEVVRRMRPLRGVAGTEALSPVLEVLEGTEEAAGGLLNRGEGLTDAHMELLGAARAALSAVLAAAERGEDAAALPELERFRDARDHLAEAADLTGDEEGVLPVSALFHDDAGPHVLSSPLAPVPAEGGSAAEEVERFLRLEATGFLDRAEALLAGLSPRREKRFAGVAGQLARLAQAVGELSGTYGVTAAADAAERAASELRTAGSAAEARGALVRLRAALPGAAPQPAQPEAGAPAADAPPPVPATPESAMQTDDGVIPIETLLLRGPAALREALALRPTVEGLAAGASPELRDRIAELFDLVRLGTEGPTPI
jgi:chemotaxis protein histidine kinase CheA